MASISRLRLAAAWRVAVMNLFDRTLRRRVPRRCTITSMGLVFTGLCIPLLMAAQLLPTTLLLGFAALVLLAAGGGLLLVRCGEI